MNILDALQKTLAAEHASIDLLRTAGGLTSASATPGLHARLSSQFATHRGRREQLVVLVRTLGGDPVPAEPAYSHPDLSRTDAVRAAAALAERRCAETYATLVASSTTQARTWAATALNESALTLLAWGQAAEAFPGGPELDA